MKWKVFFYEVKVIFTNRGPKQEGEKNEMMFFYDKVATLGWDPDRWRRMDGGCFFNYTIKYGRDSIINRYPGNTRAADKWQGYLPDNYRFFWSQMWDPLRSGKEATFMWSIWHNAVAVNEWRAKIASTSISKQCVFVCLIRVNWSSINFGIASKPGERGDGLLSLCTNFVV